MAKTKTAGDEVVNQITGEIEKYTRAVRRRSFLTKDGRELPDPTPMAPAIGFKRQPTIADRLREIVRSEHMRIAAEEAGKETFEEADDFDVGDEDDYNPRSPYEIPFEKFFDPPEPSAGQGPVEPAAEPAKPLEAPTAPTDNKTAGQQA